MRKDKLTTVNQRFQVVWSNFRIYNETRFSEFLFDENGDIQVDGSGNQLKNELSGISLTDDAKFIILNFLRYTGYDKKAYGVPVTIERGITEQESYDYWLKELSKQNAIFKTQLTKLGLTTLPQCVYDGLFVYFWFADKFLEVVAPEGIYDIRQAIVDKDWDTVASMIHRSKRFREESQNAAKIIRLAFYKKYKTRRWLRQQGVFKMRDRNELYKFNVFTEEELRRARFAYYAETKNFLPYTPEGIKRDINNRYGETLIITDYTWDGTTTQYELPKSPSMSPVEKLQVYVNDDLIQNIYDYTLDGTTVTLRKTQNYPENSEFRFVISI